MNPTRVAALLREQARIANELAAEFDGGDVPAAEESRPRAKKPRRAPSIVRPAGEASPSIASKADRILRDRGFR